LIELWRKLACLNQQPSMLDSFGSIDGQHGDRCTTNGRSVAEYRSLPNKVVGPFVASWMKQSLQFGPLKVLHARHAQARFASVVRPPCFSARM
jgi:hypothetical protein